MTDLTWLKLESTIVSKYSECRGYIPLLIHVSKDIFSRMCIRTAGSFSREGRLQEAKLARFRAKYCRHMIVKDVMEKRFPACPELPKGPTTNMVGS